MGVWETQSIIWAMVAFYRRLVAQGMRTWHIYEEHVGVAQLANLHRSTWW